MGGKADESPSVLVVDDEPESADLYADFLAQDYTVRTVYDGDAAIDAVRADSFDVVLLDRRMPGTSGDEVLHTIRSEGFDCKVAMVTAVMPDFDILEMGCEDYLVKPVSMDDLQATVERLRILDAYDEKYQELSAKRIKRNVLQVEKRPGELASSDRYRALCDRVEELEAELESIEAKLDADGPLP
jgi:DNA-binding response OmpR family regulator